MGTSSMIHTETGSKWKTQEIKQDSKGKEGAVGNCILLKTIRHHHDEMCIRPCSPTNWIVMSSGK